MAKLVLAIDDDKYVHHIIEESLAGFCKIIHAKDGDEGLRLTNKYNPDIILLDIEMPGMSGYDVCKAIKHSESTQDIPVMFLSSKIELSDRVKGYSVGASDYITKPFNAEELIARIKVLYEYRQQCAKLKLDIAKANKTAEIAMTESGDMGRIMRYVGQSYHANNFQSLSEHFFAFFAPLNLDVVVVFWYQGTGVFYSQQSGVCPLEQELLEQHRQAQRFVDIGSSTIINYPKVSLLIKNMPVDNDALYGRYKDLFPHILEVTNEKVITMERSESSYEQAAQISTALQDIVKQLTTQNIEQNKSTKVFIEQLHELDCAIKLQQTQANPADLTLYISQLDQTMQLFVSANSDLAFIKYQLKQVAESRNELISNLRTKAEAAKVNTNHHSDIELF
ncbi:MULTISPECIES: response regulator transcription factor [Pseudoalteromonas]|jgi:CheY-like chemotaxis protein|uniref:response regulator transcription factor n=1 Tax=Pseudoalteromonas TaxID=53246 RepID=UPI00020A0EDD|nr:MULTISPECIES: response regulator [Pseudoalteromonas]EGI74654.1 response regulator receiver (CheY-like) modulated metal dependent phosphohydrolase [Pseudoalteromonas distincta]MBB1275872.1 response regulator [Pseudoalteromonas sp. SR43-3]MBB1298242.1 response regulator [Pseudoalteromonas sp. SR41-7]MBB1325820.1 response regulator [Pseudoalteromonas sp. SR45-1]QQM64704.1 response regulator [Pseudoalteromonas sp. LC2018020214]|tara:strand:+ start:69913 stop:71091 length:1179 start_codon:yes stop_codon:yes gene_type:complete